MGFRMPFIYFYYLIGIMWPFMWPFFWSSREALPAFVPQGGEQIIHLPV